MDTEGGFVKRQLATYLPTCRSYAAKLRSKPGKSQKGKMTGRVRGSSLCSVIEMSRHLMSSTLTVAVGGGGGGW